MLASNLYKSLQTEPITMADLLQAGLEQLEQEAPGPPWPLAQGPLGPWAMEVRVLLGDFATGFSAPGHTKPGFGLQTNRFKVIFRGVKIDGKINEMSETLETYYDWSDVMNAVLGATRDYQELEELEWKVKLGVTKWLGTFRGWGLLFSLLHLERSRYFLMALHFTSANWNEATGGPRTDLKVFNTVKFDYEHSQSRSLASLVPTVAIWFEELEDPKVSFKDNERRKLLTISMDGLWEVQFIVEKKRLNTDLVDLAAEAVARQVRRREGLQELEVPLSLQPRLREKFRDQEWARKVRWEDNTEEMDDSDVMNTLQDFDDDPTEM